MSIFARINRLQYVTRFYGRKLPRHFYFQDPNARSRQSKRRFLFSKLCSKLGSSKKENISLVTISFRTSFRRSFANVAKKKKKIGARSYLVASLYTNFCRRPIRQGPHHVCKCTSIGPCFTTNHP